MIGLGVGIDYTLFIVTRFRQLLHDGLSPQEAAAAAGATAGRAVIFAGITVAISITGLALIGHRLHHQARASAARSACSPRCSWRTRCCRRCSRCSATRSTAAGCGMRPPTSPREGQARTWVGALGPVRRRAREGRAPDRLVVLLLLASPVLEGAPGPGGRRHGAEEPDDPQGVRPAVGGLRPGLHLADPGGHRHAVRPQAAQKLADAFKQRAGRRQWSRRSTTPRTPRQASVAIINAYSKYTPQDPKTDDIVSTLRNTVIPQTLDGSSAKAYVSGQNAAFTDIGNKILDGAVVPALRHRRDLPAAGDGVPLARDRAQGGAHDAALGAGRLRRARRSSSSWATAWASSVWTARARSRASCRRSRSRSCSASRWTTRSS